MTELGRHARRARRAASEQHARQHRPALLTVLAGIASALVLITAGISSAAYNHLNGNITTADVTSLLTHRPTKVATPKAEDKYEAENILLLGSDTREGADAKYGKRIEGQRSDTTIVLHLSADRKQAIAMSIPRDSQVELPECQRANGSTIPARAGMFNSAYALGGVACTIAAVEKLTGIVIDHYVVIDFAGFVKMVDALGGVEVCTAKPINDKKAELKLPAGRSVVKGEQALGFVRVRYIGDGTDLGRIKRQQAFLSSMAQKAMGSKLLLDPPRLYSFLDAATKSVTADPDLGSLGALQELARSMGGINLKNIQFVTVPNHPWPPDHNRVEWDGEASQQLFDALRYDRPLPGKDSTPKPTLPVAPADIHVGVYNATGISGKARSVAAELREQGIDVTTIATWDGEQQDTTEIIVGPDADQQAVAGLRLFLPDALVTDDSTRTGITLVIGRDFTSVRPLVKGPATPAPTIEARSADQDICS